MHAGADSERTKEGEGEIFQKRRSIIILVGVKKMEEEGRRRGNAREIKKAKR